MLPRSASTPHDGALRMGGHLTDFKITKIKVSNSAPTPRAQKNKFFASHPAILAGFALPPRTNRSFEVGLLVCPDAALLFCSTGSGSPLFDRAPSIFCVHYDRGQESATSPITKRSSPLSSFSLLAPALKANKATPNPDGAD